MKADADRAKAAALLGEDYKPAVPGVGAAWCANPLLTTRMRLVKPGPTIGLPQPTESHWRSRCQVLKE